MTDKAKRKAVIYTRVASVQSDADKLHERQEEACRAYALSEGYEIEAVFRDDGSGSGVDRPGLNALLAFMKTENETTVVLVESVERLTRSLWVLVHIRGAIATAGGTLRIPSFGSTKGMSDDDCEDMITNADGNYRPRADREELEAADANVR